MATRYKVEFMDIKNQRLRIGALLTRLRLENRMVELANNHCRCCFGAGAVAAVDLDATQGRVYATDRLPIELLPCICLGGWPLYIEMENIPNGLG